MATARHPCAVRIPLVAPTYLHSSNYRPRKPVNLTLSILDKATSTFLRLHYDEANQILLLNGSNAKNKMYIRLYIKELPEAFRCSSTVESPLAHQSVNSMLNVFVHAAFVFFDAQRTRLHHKRHDFIQCICRGHGRQFSIGIVCWSNLNNVCSHQFDALQASDDRAKLSGGPTACLWCARRWCKSWVESVDVNAEIHWILVACVRQYV